MTNSLKAGTYWVGDLWYVFKDHNLWMGVVNRFTDAETIAGERCAAVFQSNGVSLGMAATAYGDGVYLDTHGNNFPVDSGTLGCIPLWAVEKFADKRFDPSFGVIQDFPDDFIVAYDKGVISFGEWIVIDTFGAEDDGNDDDDSGNQFDEVWEEEIL